MSDNAERIDAVRRFVKAMAAGADGADDGAKLLADDAVFQTNFGAASGRDAAVQQAFHNPLVASFMGAAELSEPKVDGDRVTAVAAMPPTMPVGGFDLLFVFDGDRIARAEMQMLPPGPLEPSPIKLTDDLRATVNGAYAEGNAMIAAYVDDAGYPKLSPRGTTQVLDDEHLALWHRERNKGMGAAVRKNPHVTLYHMSRETRAMVQFLGRAEIVTDEALRNRIFEASPEQEQNMDFRRAGEAILITLDRVEGRGPAGRVLMSRDAKS